VGTQRAPLWSDAEGVDKLPGEWSGWLARAPDRGLPMATAAAGPTPSMTVPAPPPLATAGPTLAAAPPRRPHHSAGTSATAACGPAEPALEPSPVLGTALEASYGPSAPLHIAADAPPPPWPA